MNMRDCSQSFCRNYKNCKGSLCRNCNFMVECKEDGYRCAANYEKTGEMLKVEFGANRCNRFIEGSEWRDVRTSLC